MNVVNREVVNHQYRLAARPVGMCERSNWNYTEEAVRQPGDNEVLVGKAIRERRHEVNVATKFGFVGGTDGKGGGSIDGSAAHVREACDASLRRLGVDHIDLYYQHRVDPNVAVEETDAPLRTPATRRSMSASRPPHSQI